MIISMSRGRHLRSQDPPFIFEKKNRSKMNREKAAMIETAFESNRDNFNNDTANFCHFVTCTLAQNYS